MKNIYILCLVLLNSFMVNAQLVTCRPKLCMVDYYYHNDLVNVTHRDSLLKLKPDLLITNTPGSYWGGRNGHTGAIPSFYQDSGIKVYSYLASGYGGFKYQNHIDSLQRNLLRVDSIKMDGADGVFLDEDSSFPGPVGKAYITAIRNKCNALGLKLILNPGDSTFDPWLMTQCDYIMTDESYNGTRPLSNSEKPFADKVIVVAQGAPTAGSAAAISYGARAQGFGFSYACDSYIYLPTWVDQYSALITQPPATPVITASGNTLLSNQPIGNTWHNSSGPIAGQTAKTYTATATGNYYSIVTLQGCSSAPSNTVTITVTAAKQLEQAHKIALYPTPATSRIYLDLEEVLNTTLHAEIIDLTGRLWVSAELKSKKNELNIAHLPNGNYIVAIKGAITETLKMVIQR